MDQEQSNDNRGYYFAIHFSIISARSRDSIPYTNAQNYNNNR
jgi:hypothetical protein